MQKEHFRVGIIGCGRMADTIEDEQIERRRTHPYRGGLVLPYSHAAGYTALTGRISLLCPMYARG